MLIADISKYQARRLDPNNRNWDPANYLVEIDFDRLLSAAAAVLIRVGDGVNKDPCFDRYRAALEARGAIWGIYHLHRAESDSQHQAQLIQQWQPTLPPAGVWGDAEFTGGLARAQYFQRFSSYLAALDSVYGIWTGVYSGAWFLNPNVAVPDQAKLNNRPGWWSGYPSLIIPEGWKAAVPSYVMHQFTNKYRWPGVPDQADASMLNPALTLDALLKRRGAPAPETPPPAAPPPVVIETDAAAKAAIHGHLTEAARLAGVTLARKVN